MEIETCDTCGEKPASLIYEERARWPVQIGWVCPNGHKTFFPPPPREPLHQGALWLDEVGETLEADSEEVAQAVDDGLLVTDFGGDGVWIGDLMRWRTIRAALDSRGSDREELRQMLIARMAEA